LDALVSASRLRGLDHVVRMASLGMGSVADRGASPIRQAEQVPFVFWGCGSMYAS